MRYSIDIKDLKLDKIFIRILLFKFKLLCLSNINKKQVKRIDEDLYNLLEIEISYIRLLNLGVRKMICKRDDDLLYFIIPNNITYPDTDIKIADLLQITEFGTLSIKPYPVIRNTLHKLQKNLKLYLRRYKVVGWF